MHATEEGCRRLFEAVKASFLWGPGKGNAVAIPTSFPSITSAYFSPGHFNLVVNEHRRDMEMPILPSRPPYLAQSRLLCTPPRPEVQRDVELDIGFTGIRRALPAHRSNHYIEHVSSMPKRE